MTTGVFIGRFQPLHNGHLEIIEDIVRQNDKVLLFVGSANRSRTYKNPFTFKERKSFIEQTLKSPKVQVLPLNDHPLDEDWHIELKEKIEKNKLEGEIKFYGSFKDNSSYYLEFFKSKNAEKHISIQDGKLVEDNLFVEKKILNKIDAEFIRSTLFERDIVLTNLIPTPVITFLNKFRIEAIYWDLKEEYRYIKKYKESWSQSPYPPVFMTVDAVVRYQDSILLIKRKDPPGKGLYALPGGFMNANETLESAFLRELKEETGMVLKSTDIQEMKLFDNPDRSTRGRVVTMAYYCDVTNKPTRILDLKAGDDAESYKWVKFQDIENNLLEYHDDHLDIIKSFVDLK
jgi:bifunctional NMN adenylyltransferase/nudix hydrolase